MNSAVFQVLQEWEHKLGPAENKNNILSTEIVADSCQDISLRRQQRLYELQYHLSIVPTALGGSRHSWLQAWLLSALTTRRSVSVMPSALYSHGPTCLLELVGDQHQQQTLRDVILNQQQICFAMSEPSTGSDLLAITCTAKPTDSGWVLDGIKGPMGIPHNATHAIVLAKTASAGPASLSFFLVNIKDVQTVHRNYHNSKGMQGEPFGILHFEHYPVAASALVGKTGYAFESALKVQQYVKYMSTAASFGAGHSLLRKLSCYVQQRKLDQYGHTRYLLCRAMAALFELETTAFVAASLLSLLKPQFSVSASVCKAIANATTDEIVSTSKNIFGSRHVLNCDESYRMINQLIDDIDMVINIDTNPVTNINNIITQLAAIHAKIQQFGEEEKNSRFHQVLILLDIERTLTTSTPTAASVTNVDGDNLLVAMLLLPNQLSRISALCDNQALYNLCNEVVTQLESFWVKLKNSSLPEINSMQKSTIRIELSYQFSKIYSAGTMALFWVANYQRLSRHIDSKVFQWMLQSRLTPELAAEADLSEVYLFLTESIKNNTSLSWLPITLEQ